jgi:hypothetical protein
MLDIVLWNEFINKKQDTLCLSKINTIQFLIKKSDQYETFMNHIKLLVKKDIFPITRTLYNCFGLMDILIDNTIFEDLFCMSIPNQLYLNTDNMDLIILNHIINTCLDIEIILNLQLFILIIFINKCCKNHNNILPEVKPDLYFRITKLYYDLDIKINESDLILLILQSLRHIGIKDLSQKIQQFSYKIYLQKDKKTRHEQINIIHQRLKEQNNQQNIIIDQFIINIKKILNNTSDLILYNVIIDYILEIGLILLDSFILLFNIFIDLMITIRYPQNNYPPKFLEHVDFMKSSIKNIMKIIFNNIM